jgi:hypothetical protein
VKKSNYLFFVLLLPSFFFAQSTIKGTVTDGMRLQQTNIVLKPLKQQSLMRMVLFF